MNLETANPEDEMDESAKVQPNILYDKVLELESGSKYYSLIEKAKMVIKRTSHAMMSMVAARAGHSR